jgi:hypothetical protein
MPHDSPANEARIFQTAPHQNSEAQVVLVMQQDHMPTNHRLSVATVGSTLGVSARPMVAQLWSDKEHSTLSTYPDI